LVKSYDEQRLDRLMIGLGASALVLVAALFGLHHCGAVPERNPGREPGRASQRAPAPAPSVAPSALPTPAASSWRPGPNWATRAAQKPGPDGPLKLPLYPRWTKEQAEALFAIGPKEQYDPLCGKLWLPNERFTNRFPEYPGGEIEYVTNSRSLREDEEVRAEKPVLRVLVAGDSHTDGVCSNAESFANLTEKALVRRAQIEASSRGERFEPRWIDVLNAGKGTHSFFNYLGTLERNLDLDPDVFVVTVYGGNDFEELSWAWHGYGFDGPSPEGAARYRPQLVKAKRVHAQSLPQALMSLKFFAAYPREREIALRAATTVMERIQALCRERGIHLIVLYLPSRPEVEPENPDLSLPALLSAFELTPAALDTTRAMANQFLARIAELGIEAVDLRPAFLESKESPYWSWDWHINLVGHRLVAGALSQALCARK
jgi:hypothetical protein